jgi:hypothetical protein
MKDDLDMSWINDYSRMHTIQQIMNKEELDSIVLQTIYMNKNLEIAKIDKENINLNNINNTNRCITKEQLLQIIQTKQIVEKCKYKLFDIVLLTLDLDPVDIQKYVNEECGEIIRLKSVQMKNNDIIIPPSIFVFHSLHTFYLFFEEVDTPSIKSILKTNIGENTKNNHTKKVCIAENENTVILQKPHNKTRKIWDNTHSGN